MVSQGLSQTVFLTNSHATEQQLKTFTEKLTFKFLNDGHWFDGLSLVMGKTPHNMFL